jgi:UDP-glucose 4-epimerase
MVRVLILGAGGFIGRHFVDALSRREEVSITGFGRTVPDTDARIEFIRGELEDTAFLARVAAGHDAIYHFVSQTIPATSWDSPMCEVERNLAPTVRLIEAAAEAGVKKFFFASSGGTVYGFNEDTANEQHGTEPFSPYGIIKRTIEGFLLHAKLASGMDYEVYRISNVYGEGQRTSKGLGFINTVLENLVSGRETVVYGDGENVRDYLYAPDLANILDTRFGAGLEGSETFNVSSGDAVTLNELIEIIGRVTGVTVDIKRLPSRSNDNRSVRIDNRKILAACPGISLTPLEEGILKTYRHLVSRNVHAV